MTQDLVIGVLLTGLVGIIWAMTVSVLWSDHPIPDTTGVASSGEQAVESSANQTGTKHSSIAA